MLLCLCRGDLLCGQSPLLPAARVASCWYGLSAVKSLLPDARKRLSLVVTYCQPLSCFIFLRLLLDILLNLFLHFYLLYPRNIPNTPLRQNSFTKLLFLYQEHLVIHATFLCANPLPNLLFLYLAHPVIHVISSAPES